MTNVTAVLSGYLFIYTLRMVVALSLFHRPVEEILHHDFQIADTQVTSLHVIVSEVLGEVSGVDDTQELLCAKFIHRVACLGCNPLVEHLLFIFRSLRPFDQAIAPVDGINVVYADGRREQVHASFHVARLSHIVVARVVHNAWCRAVFLRE